MRRETIAGMPTWEASAREREMVVRAYARRKRARSSVPARGAGLLVFALLVALVLLMPSLVEIMIGAGLIALGLLLLACRARPRPRHRLAVLPCS